MAAVVVVTGLVAGLIAHQAGVLPGQHDPSDDWAHQPAKPVQKERGDFDQDGYEDLVAVSSTATVDGVKDSGYAVVLYGSAQGIDTGRRQILSQHSEGVEGGGRKGVHFGGGGATAADLDGDGVPDLAVGSDHGVTLFWGTRGGRLSGGTLLPRKEFDTGELALVSGDFDGDGHADLATDSRRYGRLTALYGPFTRDGKVARTAYPRGRDQTLRDMTVGDLDGDGRDDLVSRHALEDLGPATLLWRGGARGLKAPGKKDELPHASAVVLADVDDDGYDDLVMSRTEGPESEAGRIEVVHGTRKGPGRRTVLERDAMPRVGDGGEWWGAALAAGDVDGDGVTDIVVGALSGTDELPEEGGKEHSGAVVLLKGSKKGLTGKGGQVLDQDSPGVPGKSEAGDSFGTELTLRDTDGDGRADLAVSAPQEDGVHPETGATWVLRGDAGGLTTRGATSFWPESLGAPAGEGTSFGSPLGD
ncbi:FG-GAP-like repeat-containing protein [Streptomyces sp. NPDC005438]|uniref:FG-GAP-like repeat-containing protein n=1 Tax=Streptomyces sp. NPDC005438 TaxID=3156880 RepID=UPI0033A8BFC7